MDIAQHARRKISRLTRQLFTPNECAPMSWEDVLGQYRFWSREVDERYTRSVPEMVLPVRNTLGQCRTWCRVYIERVSTRQVVGAPRDVDRALSQYQPLCRESHHAHVRAAWYAMKIPNMGHGVRGERGVGTCTAPGAAPCATWWRQTLSQSRTSHGECTLSRYCASNCECAAPEPDMAKRRRTCYLPCSDFSVAPPEHNSLVTCPPSAQDWGGLQSPCLRSGPSIAVRVRRKRPGCLPAL
eukprot:3336909-Rhodomonas_salina.4